MNINERFPYRTVYTVDAGAPVPFQQHARYPGPGLIERIETAVGKINPGWHEIEVSVQKWDAATQQFNYID